MTKSKRKKCLLLGDVTLKWKKEIIEFFIDIEF